MLPEDKELANMLRTIIQEELKPVNEKLTALETGQVELRTDVQRIEATVNDIRATNRRTFYSLGLAGRPAPPDCS